MKVKDENCANCVFLKKVEMEVWVDHNLITGTQYQCHRWRNSEVVTLPDQTWCGEHALAKSAAIGGSVP